MREVTISPKTAFRIIQTLSLSDIGEARALIALISREALGDIKAEEKGISPVEQGYDAIWAAFGMIHAGRPTLQGILSVIENDKKRDAERHKNLEERFNLLESIKDAVGASKWTEILPTLREFTETTDARDAVYKRQITDLKHDATLDEEALKYLRQCTEQLRVAAGIQEGFQAAEVVGSVINALRIHQQDAEQKTQSIEEQHAKLHSLYLLATTDDFDGLQDEEIRGVLWLQKLMKDILNGD